MRKRTDGGPGFPTTMDNWADGFGGMSLRDWFAGMAAVGFINSDIDLGAEKAACWAYELADAMLAERERPSEATGKPGE